MRLAILFATLCITLIVTPARTQVEVPHVPEPVVVQPVQPIQLPPPVTITPVQIAPAPTIVAPPPPPAPAPLPSARCHYEDDQPDSTRHLVCEPAE
jgi:hypothetical protein